MWGRCSQSLDAASILALQIKTSKQSNASALLHRLVPLHKLCHLLHHHWLQGLGILWHLFFYDMLHAFVSTCHSNRVRMVSSTPAQWIVYEILSDVLTTTHQRHR